MICRREAVVAVATATALGGCLSRSTDVAVDRSAERRNRLYTCSYDATVAALEDETTPDTRWHVSTLMGQTRDIMPDRNGNLLIVDDRGLHKYAEERDGLDLQWRYLPVGGSCRGITVDIDNDYYVGSWTANQGFHKITETDVGTPEQAWIYHWSNDSGMITAASNPRKDIALALKNGEVHLIREIDGKPEYQWRWSAETGSIIREVIWDGAGDLYVASEDHHLYKLAVKPDCEPELLWSYDAGSMLFGASVTPYGEIYAATNDGTIHSIGVENGRPYRQWVYQHTTYDGTAPTDRYFWDGLVHQVAASPDPDVNAVYSCSYGENSVHRIDAHDSHPEPIWQWTGHNDHVREVRVHGESVGTTPELWNR